MNRGDEISMNLNLSEEQSNVVKHEEGALLVIAGPGAGKTRVLTERIKRLLNRDEKKFHILALTFTNKAANEMKERLSEVPNLQDRTFIGTIHSFCKDVLLKRGMFLGIKDPIGILQGLEEQKGLIYEAINNDSFLKTKFDGMYNTKERSKFISDMLSYISEQKLNMITPEMLPQSTEREVYEAYNLELSKSHLLDFNDLLLNTYLLFTKFPKIANLYRKQYEYIFIDEAQDLSKSHYELLKALCVKEFKNVMMVGDKNQSIYGFNGSSPEYMDLFQKDFDAKKIELTKNFRSSKAVVKAAKCLFKDYNVNEQLPIQGSIKLIVSPDEKSEAKSVLDYIKDKIQNGDDSLEMKVSWDKFAILGRNRYVFKHIVELLKAEKIPFYERLSNDFQYESDIMREFECCIFLLSNPFDIIHKNILIKQWGIKNMDLTLTENVSNGVDLIKKLKSLTTSKTSMIVYKAIESILYKNDDFNLRPALKFLNSYSSEIIDENERFIFTKDLEDYELKWNNFLRKQEGGYHNISSFLSSIALGETDSGKKDGIGILTLHSSKGLEFDVVVIIGMVEGIFPDYRANTHKKLDEERRNAFVAITRSRRLLVLSYPETRVMPWGAELRSTPSRFLEEIKEAIQ